MKNEFGVTLDKNGYAPTIIQRDMEHCYLCGRCDQKLDRHEPFNGPYRKKSKELGMWMLLCSERCHHGGAHKDFQTSAKLKKWAQQFAMAEYMWSEDEFRERFGKSWL